MIKLNAEELLVSSFDTTAEPAADSGVEVGIATKTTCSLEPTMCTYCFICPPLTAECA